PVLAATVTSWSMSGCAVRQWVRPAYRRPCPPPRHGSPICLGQRALDKLVLRCACTDCHEGTQLMHPFVRSVARRTSIGLGALALAVGVAACGGDDGQESAPEQDPGSRRAPRRRMSSSIPATGTSRSRTPVGRRTVVPRPPTATGTPRSC